MYKKTVTFTDFNGDEKKRDLYFNLTEAELSEMALSVNGGLDKLLQKIIDEGDNAKIVEYFKKIILMSYGEKSLDGESFIKYDENGRKLSDKFVQTAAYSALFMELSTDAEAAADFINKIIPKKMRQNIEDIKPVK